MTSPVNLLQLNQECECFPISRDKVDRSVLSLTDYPNMHELLARREHYFASTPVFISPQMTANMQEQITAIEHFMKLPAYQNDIFQRSALAAFAPAKSTHGAFMGYDFHITEEGPRLIEINSNAGGAYIVNAIQKAIGLPHQKTEMLIFEMFQREWELSGQQEELSSIAIIDEAPEDQFHYPDMLLAADLFRRQGLSVTIVDAKDLEYRNSAIFAKEKKIDLIYNRLTDFDLSRPEHKTLRQAWLDEAVVLTPDPRHHALYADKQNLTLLTDPKIQNAYGASPDQKRALSRIPKTIDIDLKNADYLWLRRKDYFFKPRAGYGGRAVYKGAKLTKKTWAHILQGGYVAQEYIRPPVRVVGNNESARQLKYDVRVYSYAGSPLLMAARVYQGQVTNLRTDGGGLAPVLELTNPTCRK